MGAGDFSLTLEWWECEAHQLMYIWCGG